MPEVAWYKKTEGRSVWPDHPKWSHLCLVFYLVGSSSSSGDGEVVAGGGVLPGGLGGLHELVDQGGEGGGGVLPGGGWTCPAG